MSTAERSAECAYCGHPIKPIYKICFECYHLIHEPDGVEARKIRVKKERRALKKQASAEIKSPEPAAIDPHRPNNPYRFGSQAWSHWQTTGERHPDDDGSGIENLIAQQKAKKNV